MNFSELAVGDQVKIKSGERIAGTLIGRDNEGVIIHLLPSTKSAYVRFKQTICSVRAGQIAAITVQAGQ